jgi:hypothetical protein
MGRVAGLHRKSKFNLFCKGKDSKNVISFGHNCFCHPKYDGLGGVIGEISRCQLNNP